MDCRETPSVPSVFRISNVAIDSYTFTVIIFFLSAQDI